MRFPPFPKCAFFEKRFFSPMLIPNANVTVFPSFRISECDPPGTISAPFLCTPRAPRYSLLFFSPSSSLHHRWHYFFPGPPGVDFYSGTARHFLPVILHVTFFLGSGWTSIQTDITSCYFRVDYKYIIIPCGEFGPRSFFSFSKHAKLVRPTSPTQSK